MRAVDGIDISHKVKKIKTQYLTVRVAYCWHIALQMAGDEGFEPPNGGVKVRCLTAWRIPKKTQFRRKARAFYEIEEICQNKMDFFAKKVKKSLDIYERNIYCTLSPVTKIL